MLPIALTVVGLPVGWWLLNAAAVDSLTKYGLTYSGVDFMLGPDRTQKLPEFELILRWCVVYLGAVVTIAVGTFIGLSGRPVPAAAGPVDAHLRAPQPAAPPSPVPAPAESDLAPTPTPAPAPVAAAAADPPVPPEEHREPVGEAAETAEPPPSPDVDGAQEIVRLRPDQVELLDGLAARLNMEPSDAVAEIIEWFIDDCQTRDSSPPAHASEAARGEGFGTLAVVDTPLRFRADHMAFLSMVAERSGASVSRTTRQIIDQFSAGL